MNEDLTRMINPVVTRIFDLEALPRITLEISEVNWDSLLMAYDRNPGQNFWIPGNFRYEEGRQLLNRIIGNVGLRVRGNSSRQRPEGDLGQQHDPDNPVWRQASFALDFGRFSSGQTFEGLSRLDLKFTREDPTRIREVYAFDLLQQARIFTGPLISMCRFFIQIGNGRPAYFGIYKLKEFIDEDYLANRVGFLGDFPRGSRVPFLWKGDNGAALNDYNPMVIANRDIYDLRTNTNQRALANAQLTDFVRNLVTLQGTALENWANATMDVNLLMRTYMASVLCGNMDDYWYNSNNFNFYFNTHGRFFFIPNDFDTTLGTGWSFDAGRQSVRNWGRHGNPLIFRLIDQVPQFWTLYTSAFHELTQGVFNVSNSILRIQRWQHLIQPHLWDETVHFGCASAAGWCTTGSQGSHSQTPFRDETAWWTSGGNNRNYRLFGSPNFFTTASEVGRLAGPRNED